MGVCILFLGHNCCPIFIMCIFFLFAMLRCRNTLCRGCHWRCRCRVVAKHDVAYFRAQNLSRFVRPPPCSIVIEKPKSKGWQSGSGPILICGSL